MNKPDRLLSEEQFYEQCPISSYIVTKPALVEQDLKTAAAVNAEWVARIDNLLGKCEKPCINCDASGYCRIKEWEQLKEDIEENTK